MRIQTIFSCIAIFFAHFFLIVGTFIMMSGFFGMWRNKSNDIINKMHFLATGESCGFLLCVIGLILYFSVGAAIAIKLTVIAFLFWFSNAVTAYNIGKTSYILSSKNDKM